MKNIRYICLLGLLTLSSCAAANEIAEIPATQIPQTQPTQTQQPIISALPEEYEPKKFIAVNKDGMTIKDRFLLPDGYTRVDVEDDSFGAYLRNLPLKNDGSKVLLYNGSEKRSDVYDAVVDMEIGDRDLQQCADAVIRLRAEYLYSMGRYDDIHFNFVNGFNAEYKKWAGGYRINVNGNNAGWVKNSAEDYSYQTFRKYLDMVFAYAGTLSLNGELISKDVKDIEIGDVFIVGGSPGHCVIVVDLAENSDGEKIFIIAQSYMPAQDIQVLKNTNTDTSPWYSSDFGEVLKTPEWRFKMDDLKTWE